MNFLATLLPGVAKGGFKFLKRTVGDIMQGKNVLNSIKDAAISTLKEEAPLVADFGEKLITGLHSRAKKKIEPKVIKKLGLHKVGLAQKPVKKMKKSQIMNEDLLLSNK